MALPGGSADKLGNRYEGRWTAVCTAKVLHDQAEAIELEPPRSDGIEFKLYRPDGLVEHHQAKRQTSDGRSWTMEALAREGILAAIDRWTGDNEAFVFVSTSPVVTDMTELVAHAHSAESLAGFIELVAASSHAAGLDRLRREWPERSDDEIWLALSRSEFRQADERTVRELASALLLPLVDTDPDSVIRTLADFALECVNQRLTGTRLWAFLDESKVPRRDWANDPRVRAVVERQRDRYLASLRGATIRDRQLSRPQAREIAASLRDAEGAQRILISAPAGLGKSVIVAQAVEQLTTAAVLVLPFRLDRIELASLPDELGARLGLPGSPGRVLAALAAGDAAVLVIDQLDAVSQVSGRNPSMLECVEEVLREVAAYPNVRILMAARGFDLEADPRLRRLRSAEGTQVVQVEPLDDEQVAEILGEIGVDPSRLSEGQRSLLRAPLNLRLLSDSQPIGPTFGSVLDLYEGYWRAKQTALRDQLGRDVHWTEVIDALCEEMTERQMLSVPADVVDHLRSDVDAMLSEHVLVQEERRILFFHEGFFDFAFAKRFAAGGRSLVTFLRSTDQGLFHRSQTRQILAYRRMADSALYERDLAEILLAPDIRFHLKALVIAWLGTLQDPSEREWAIVSQTLIDPGLPVAEHVVRLLATSPEWFDRADAAGDIKAWLTDSDARLIDRAVWIAALMQRHRGSRVARLLRECPRDDEDWRRRHEFVVARADMAVDEAFLELVLDLVAAGCFDDLKAVHVANGSFWDLAHGLAAKRPGWAARLARAYLERRIILAKKAGVENPFLDAAWIADPIEQDLFAKAATGDPSAYAAELLPTMLAVLEANKRWNEDELRWEDSIWRWRSSGRTSGVRDGLLGGMEIALAALARSDAGSFDRYRKLLEGLRFETTDFLLVRAFTNAAEREAETAAAFLLAEPTRLHAGYMNDGHWATRDLLAAIYPHLSEETRVQLESIVLQHYPTWERSVAGHKSHGRAQYTILSGLPRDLLSTGARARLAEWQRKFEFVPEAPKAPKVSRVEPPVPREVAPKLSDGQWLRAIAKYSSDRTAWRADRGMVGGLHELAGLLQESTTSDPVRFAGLVLRMPIGTDPAYYEGVLRGLHATDVAVPSDLVFDVCRRCHELPGRPCGRVICDPIAKQAGSSPLPDDIVRLLAWYAVEDPDPAPDQGSAEIAEGRATGKDGFERTGLRLLDRGINTNRGRAAVALRTIVDSQPGLLPALNPVLERMVEDPSPAVGACVAESLLAVMAIDRDLAVRLFGRLSIRHKLVAASAPAEHFIRSATITHPEAIVPVIERLLESGDPEAEHVGGRQASLAAFSTDLAEPLAARALTGSLPARFGAAEVYAANLGDPGLGETCAAALRVLFADESSEVRREAASGFGNLKGDQVGRVQDLVEAFAVSPALADNPRDFLDALLETTSPLPDATALVCRRLIDLAGHEAGTIASAWSAEMPDVAALAIRLHSFGSESARRDALDVIDELAAVSAYRISETLLAFERAV